MVSPLTTKLIALILPHIFTSGHDFGLWYLTSLSTIFQLSEYIVAVSIIGRGVPEENHRNVTSH